jgi:hypothetical protein
MNKEFCTYEQALALKELGFDEKCFAMYNEYEELIWNTEHSSLCYNSQGYSDMCTAPTYSEAFRWLRKNHNLYVDIFVDDNKTFGFMITHFTSEGRVDSPVKYNHITYEEAEQACLDKLIKIFKRQII